MKKFVDGDTYRIGQEDEQAFLQDVPTARKIADGVFLDGDMYDIDDAQVDAFKTDIPTARPLDEIVTPQSAPPVVAPAVKSAPEPSSITRRVLGDTGVALARGVIGFPEGLVGLADIPTFGMVGKGLEKVGVDFKGAKDILSDLYSPEAKAAQAAVGEGFKGGVIEGVKSIFENPSTIATGAVESLPSMLGGGAIAKTAASKIPMLATAIKAGGAAATRAGGIAGAIGETAMTAGSAAEQVRQATENGLLTPKQAAIVAASGLLTGIIGRFGNRASQALGLTDVDTLMAIGKNASPQATRGLLMSIFGGMVSEGVLEELPQSIQEQAAQNIAQGKPWDEGVPESGAMGAVIGGFMGGGSNIISPPTTTPAAEATTATPIAEPQPAPSPVEETPQDAEYNAAFNKIKEGILDGAAIDVLARATPSARKYIMIARESSNPNHTAEMVQKAHEEYLAAPKPATVEVLPTGVTGSAGDTSMSLPVDTTLAPEPTATPIAPTAMTDEQKVDARAKVLDDPAQSAELDAATAKVAAKEPLAARDAELLDLFGIDKAPMSPVATEEQQPLFNEDKVPQEGPIAPSDSELSGLFGFQKPATAVVEKPANTKYDEIRRKIISGKVLSSGEIAVINEDGKPLGMNQEDLKEQGWEYNPQKKQLVRNEKKYSEYTRSKQDAARRMVIEDPKFDATLKVADQKLNDGDPLTFPELRVLEAAGRRPDKAGYVATRKNGIVKVEKKTTISGIEVEKVKFVSDNGARYEIYKSKNDGRTIVVMRNMSGDMQNNVIYTRIHESPTDAQFDVNDLISRRNNTASFSRVAPGTPVSRMTQPEVETTVRQLGYNKNVRVINDPAQMFDAQLVREVNPRTGAKQSVFVVNAAYATDAAQIQNRLEHEAIHQTRDISSTIEQAMAVLTGDEITAISTKMTELGYGDDKAELQTRGAQLLYDEYNSKAWYQKVYAVAMTTLERLGMNLTPAQKRVAASRMAAIAINQTIRDIKADKVFETFGNDPRAIGLIAERSQVKGHGDSFFQKLRKFRDDLTVEGVQIDPSVSPQSAIAKPYLDSLSSVMTSALSEARAIIWRVVGGMTDKKVRNFNMMMVAREAIGTAKKKEDGSMELTNTSVFKTYDDAVAAWRDLVRKDNVAYGGDLQARITRDLAMYTALLERGVALGRLNPSVLDNPTYIPHYTLSHFSESVQDLQPLKHREDQTAPFLTDYIRYRWESMSKIMSMLNYEEALQQLSRKIDTANVARQVAKFTNMANLLEENEAQYRMLQEEYASLSALDNPTPEQQARMGQIDATIRTIEPKLWEADKELVIWEDDLRAVLGATPDATVGEMLRDASRSRKKMIRNIGEAYLEAFGKREKYIMDTVGKEKYLSWGFNGSKISESLYKGKGQASVDNRMKDPFQQSLKDGLKGFVGIDPNIIDQFFRDDIPLENQVEGGSQELIVDQQIADALKRMKEDSNRRHNDFFRNYKTVVKWWAMSKTIAPLNIVPYIVTNFLTDSNHFISVMLSEDWATKRELMRDLPSMMKAAWHDSVRMNFKNAILTDPLLYLARKQGLIQMNVAIQTGALQGEESQGAFGVGGWKQQLEYAKAHPFRYYGQKAGQTTATFEDVLRIVYARHYLKQLNKGRSVYDIVHSVEDPRTIEAVLNDGNPHAKERAAILMAKSSAIDYTIATRAGQMMREYGVLPFYRWVEGNFFRQLNLLRNVAKKVNNAEKAAAALTGATPNQLKVNAKIAAGVAYRLVAMNLILMMMRAYMKAVWPEEYERLMNAGQRNFLILFRDKKGIIKTMRAETAANAIWNAARSNPDLQNEPNNAQTMAKGILTAPLTMARSAMPVVQLFGNIAKGSADNFFTGKKQEQTFLDLVAKEYGLTAIADSIQRKPREGTAIGNTLKRLAPRLSDTDTDRLAYDNVVTSINRYLKKYGRGRTRTSDSGEQAVAFINFRRSLEVGEEKLAKYWYEEYIATGGDTKNVNNALKTKDFKDIFDKQDINMWLASKDTTDMERKWYADSVKWLMKDTKRKAETLSRMPTPNYLDANRRASKMIMDLK